MDVAKTIDVLAGAAAFHVSLSACGQQEILEASVKQAHTGSAPEAAIEQSLPRLIESEEDLLEVRRVFEQVLGQVKTSAMDAPFPSAVRPLPEASPDPGNLAHILMLAAWLRTQEVVADVRFPIHSAEGASAIAILPSHPAQITGEIDLRESGDQVGTYTLTLTVESSGFRLTGLRAVR